ncbi:TBC domain containing protein [Tritrichomonas foetus]|uniref:TBC domain containing protein n=1 Tax=Tritrichomonas foetus TaxID=1144522 RepID=A0A1J4JRT9_9EUKA|nr:TBC domain containing protein [Tritrichomonas foetus]|eukprot:OHT01849.1 TBC domain containing protein [Tritrichomonas foetus]
MDEGRSLVIQAPNVDFQIEPKKRNSGILSLYSSDLMYIIEWIPDPKRDKSILIKRNIPPKVTVSFQQIIKIERVNDSFNRVALSFSLEGNSRLPLFIFHSFPHIFVSHFLEFLIYKNVIRVSKKHPTVFNVLQTYKNSIKCSDNYNDFIVTNQDFQNLEKTDLTPEEVVSIHTHNQILTSIGYKQENKNYSPISISDIICSDFSEIKRLIFLKGIAPESRPLIWPILFGVLPYSADASLIGKHLKKITNEYLNIQTQYQQLTDDQIRNSSLIQDIQRVINNDVQRNDRQDESFKGDNNPNLSLLHNVLIAYSIFNRDTSYVQGMNDLVSPLIVIFIKEWKDGNAFFYDGTIKTKEEAEAFIFWSFVGMMELTQHERLFTDLAHHQAFILERVAAIATAFHHPLKKLLESAELNNLSFLFKPMVLIFKRAFKTSELWRLWDSIFTAESPPCFSRFVGAAILILLFPKLLIHTNQTLGEVMCFADGFMNEVEIESVLSLASILMARLGRGHPLHDFVYESMPDKNEYKRFYPKYFKLK